jgi:hypothetical protein
VNVKRYIVPLLATALLGAGVPQISLAPATVELHVRPGQSIKQTLTLNNQTGQDLEFEMYARDVIVKNGKRTFADAGVLPHSIAATAIFSQREGHVDPQSQKSVQVLLTVPAQTSIRAVAVYFRNKRVIAPHGAVMLNASLGALVTFILTDNIALQAGTVRVTPPTETQIMQVNEELANSGSEPIVPQGVAAFVDASGALVAKAPFEQQRLLPGERLAFSAQYPGVLPRGAYRVVCSFQFEGKTWTTEGRYTAP